MWQVVFRRVARVAAWAVVVGPGAIGLALSQTVPGGWLRQGSATEAVQRFLPREPAAGEDTEVIYQARASLAGAGLEAWLLKSAGDDAPPPGGQWLGAPKAGSGSANVASVTRAWRDAAGSQGLAIYMAVSIDQRNARLARWTANSETTARRHGAAATALMKQLAEVEKTAAAAEQRGTALEAEPPRVEGIRAGGPLVPGRYVGNFLSGSKEVLREVDLLLHANGEYEFLSAREARGGTIRYQSTNGKLDLVDPCINSRYHPDEDFCLFGRDKDGQPVIYAEDDYGVGTFTLLMRRVGEVDRLPPTQAQAKKAAEQAEAERYKFVTEPGLGLKLGEIATVLYAWKQVYTVGGMEMQDRVYLLLKDGSVHDGLPVPPQDLDVPLSRRQEPQKWGRWRREGAGYAIAWPDKPGAYIPVQQAREMQPARRGATLQGQWQRASSYAIPGGAAAWSTRQIRLQDDGRFQKSQWGGAGASGAPGTEVVTGMVFDDKGSVSSTSAPGVAIGVRRDAPERGDRSGRYELDGYLLVLSYDNGSVVRQPFFTNAQRSEVWFEGALLWSKR